MVPWTDRVDSLYSIPGRAGGQRCGCDHGKSHPSQDDLVTMTTPSVEHSLDDLRQMGNHKFIKGEYDHALALYSTAIETADSQANKEALILNLCNRSACFGKMDRHEEAQIDAHQALGASNFTNIKAFYRLAKTQMALKSFSNAMETIQAGLDALEDTEHNHDENNAVNRQRKAFKELLADAQTGESSSSPEQNGVITSVKDVARMVSIREFIKDQELGVGNFSEIVVATHRITQERFALKIISKKQATDLAKRQHPNVYNEIQMERRTLLERLGHHINIVCMYHAFQDYNSFYYLMDLHMDSGDLWSRIRLDHKMVGCHRSLIKVYLLEILDAIEHIHSHGIVHRDLKPENVLLSSTGHVIVIDFGTAKDSIETDLNGPEFVGTPDFMSPEAVTGSSGPQAIAEERARGNQGADHTADLWALGAIAFQLHTGMTPFWSPSPYLAFLKIKRCNLLRPWGITDDHAWDIIQALMQQEPKCRLGAECFQLKGNLTKSIVKTQGGYNIIRKHPYFCEKSEHGDLPVSKDFRNFTPIPTLRDLSIRACAELVRQDANDLDVCDLHPPGDGSSRDMLRLDARDRKAVMHLLERQKSLQEPMIYRRFFDSLVGCRLDKIRQSTRDYVGLTQMTDNMGQFPAPAEPDPYSATAVIDPISVVQITNPLLVRSCNQSCPEEARKQHMKSFKKCIATINRARPKVVVCCGFIDDSCRKLLARINDSIPVVAMDGNHFFSVWHSGACFLFLQSSNLEPGNDQVKWLREVLEQSRMAKFQLFVFCDCDPRSLPPRILKQLIRGRANVISGLSDNEELFEKRMSYEANEVVDDASIKSNDSIEDEMDEYTCRVVGCQENGLRTISIFDREKWTLQFDAIVSNKATG